MTFTAAADGGAAPVEYAVAVERYLAGSGLAAGSRRVYRIALTTWAWTLVGRTPPAGAGRRGAAPPALPLSRLESPEAPELLREAFAARCAAVGARTANREAAALDSATAWWRERGWLPATAAARVPRTAPPLPPQRRPSGRAAQVLALNAPLREQTLWHLLHESGAPATRVLALDVTDLDLAARRIRPHLGPPLHWGPATARLLPLLTLGHPTGPLFRTPRGTPLSYRRAAELLTHHTRPLDPSGHGWPLRTLSEER